MKRVQLQLTDEQHSRLQQRAADAGRPVAALVRDALDAWMAAPEADSRLARALAVVGGFRSGLGDLAEEHDRYLE